MLSLRLFARNITPTSTVSVQRLHASIRLFDSDSESDESKKEGKEKKAKNKEPNSSTNPDAIDRLNKLLLVMQEKPKITKTVDVAVKPKQQRSQKFKAAKIADAEKSKPFEDKLIGAAKDVAVALGGNVKQTESELLNKILSSKSQKIETDVTSTADEKSQSPINLSDLLAGMKIDRSERVESSTHSSRAAQVRRAMQVEPQSVSQQLQKYRRPNQRMPTLTGFKLEKVDLEGGTPLGIFKADSTFTPHPNTPSLSTWDALEKREFKLTVTHPPSNIIQQMILWTEQGKLWKFPIDNEQGLEDEQDVPFTDHILLERHLEGWCPKKGPIRHFMELVCIGLSKNPYVSAKEKKEHILWFKDYFDKRGDLLQELGVYNLENLGAKTTQVEAQ